VANAKHLKILNQGVEVWNQWRRENRKLRPDLNGADFINTKLSRADLSGADFINAKLRDADLSNAKLSGANLSNAKLSGANLSNAKLSGANLSRARLTGVDFSDADLSNAKLSDAKLINAKLNRARLTDADLSKIDLSNAKLSFAKLINANLSDADLSRASLGGASLGGADLSRTSLGSADLSNAELSNAELSNTDLSNTDLSNADLSNADLSNADLSGTNLSNAKLSGVNLSGVNLRASQILNTDFKNANLTGACIEDWQIGSSTNLADVQCDYIYRKYDWETGEFTHRLPADPDSTFALGEFAKRFQILESAVETIDLTFTEGIDWQAFFASFQALRDQHADDAVSIQGMERKGAAFVVRLQVEGGADKGAIETEMKRLYQARLHALEAQLQLQGAHLQDARQWLDRERQQNTELVNAIATLAAKQGDTYTTHIHGNAGSILNQGHQSNVAGEVAGHQIESVESSRGMGNRGRGTGNSPENL